MNFCSLGLLEDGKYIYIPEVKRNPDLFKEQFVWIFGCVLLFNFQRFEINGYLLQSLNSIWNGLIVLKGSEHGVKNHVSKRWSDLQQQNILNA